MTANILHSNVLFKLIIGKLYEVANLVSKRLKMRNVTHPMCMHTNTHSNKQYFHKFIGERKFKKCVNVCFV